MEIWRFVKYKTGEISGYLGPEYEINILKNIFNAYAFQRLLILNRDLESSGTTAKMLFVQKVNQNVN